MRIVLLDLETFGFQFKADKSFILCGSYKTFGQNDLTTIVRKNLGKHMWDDKEVCKKLYMAIANADMIVTHNGKRFDIPFLNTRLIKHKLPPLPPIPHFDTCEVIWKRLKMSGRLENAQKFFGLADEKTPLNLETWCKAAAGNKAALREVVEHCEADVRVLELAYKRLRPLGFKHPNVGVIAEDTNGCPICGAKGSLLRRGFIINQTQRTQRYQCKKCGGWSHKGFSKKVGTPRAA